MFLVFIKNSKFACLLKKMQIVLLDVGTKGRRNSSTCVVMCTVTYRNGESDWERGIVQNNKFDSINDKHTA